MSDTLKALGIEPDADEHPANTAVLDQLGLKPDQDEHPSSQAPVMIGDRILVERARTPGKENVGGGVPSTSALQRVHEAIDPLTVIPAWASRTGEAIGEHASAGVGLARRGLQDITENRPATGVGRVVMGGLGAASSPLTGAVQSTVEEPLAQLTGNPQFAERAAMLMPMNVGGPVAKTATYSMRPSTKALDLVAERMTPEALARLQENPRLRPMDVSKGVRDLGVGIAKDTSQPNAMGHVVSSMENSAATAKDAVRGTYDSSMGKPPPNLFEEYQRLQNQSREVGKTKIQPALDAAGPVDTSKVIDNIDKVLKPGVQSVASPGVPFQTRLQSELQEWKQELFKDGSMLTDPHRLHEVQSELRRYAEELSMSLNGTDKRLGRQLYDVRNQIVGAIDKSAPGYKAGLEAYKDSKDIDKAFEFGRDVLKNTSDLKTDPSYLEQWVKHKDRSPEELAAAKLGARQAVEGKMSSIKSSGLDPGRSGTDVPQVDFNRKKLEHLFGKEATDKMFKHLQDERDIAVTNSRGLSNSTTAEAQAAQAALKPREISPAHAGVPDWLRAIGGGLGVGAVSGSPTIGAIAGSGLLGARAVKTGYDWIGHQRDLARNASLAQLISRNDPETIAKLATAMQRVGSRNKLSNLLAPP